MRGVSSSGTQDKICPNHQAQTHLLSLRCLHSTRDARSLVREQPFNKVVDFGAPWGAVAEWGAGQKSWLLHDKLRQIADTFAVVRMARPGSDRLSRAFSRPSPQVCRNIAAHNSNLIEEEYSFV